MGFISLLAEQVKGKMISNSKIGMSCQFTERSKLCKGKIHLMFARHIVRPNLCYVDVRYPLDCGLVLGKLLGNCQKVQNGEPRKQF